MPSAKDVTAETEFLKALVIGSPGTGKSVFASTFPTPGFVFDFSSGILIYRGKDFDYEQYTINPQGWIKFEKDFKEVEAKVKEGKYVTVVLDDITAMTDLAMERALQLDPKRSPSGGPIWNIHYMMLRNLMEGYLRRFINLSANLVIIAHMDVTKDDETGAILEVKPLMTGQLALRAPGYFDEVYYTLTRKEGDKVKWLIQTVPIGLKNARSRLSGVEGKLPCFLENDYSKVMAHITAKVNIKAKTKTKN